MTLEASEIVSGIAKVNELIKEKGCLKLASRTNRSCACTQVANDRIAQRKAEIEAIKAAGSKAWQKERGVRNLEKFQPIFVHMADMLIKLGAPQEVVDNIPDATEVDSATQEAEVFLKVA
jgi:hypothetical protein